MDRGSVWQKWDLHLHSPKTWLNNQFGAVTTDDFIGKVVDSGIKVVGLTNYFRFAEGEITGQDNIKKRLEAAGIVVFPVIEFRLSHTNKQGDLCDYHLLFDPLIELKKIDCFLSNLDVVVSVTNKKASALTDDECKANTTFVDFNKLHEALDDKSLGLEGMYMCGFLSRGKGESRSATVPDYICNKSHFIIHSSDSEENIQDDYEFWTKDTTKPIKPIYQGSDAHKLDDVGKKFTWIKAKTTFNGLRQTRYNPAERISFNQNIPYEIKTQGFLINKVTFGGNDEILFNPDLNSIIGRRGNGKSILLKALAMKIDEDGYAQRVSDEYKVSRDKKFIDTKFMNLNVIWNDSAENGGTEDNIKKVFYLPQGYLSSLAYDDGNRVKERDDFLLSLLRKNETFDSAEKLVNEFINTNSQIINGLIDSIVANIESWRRIVEINRSVGNPEEIKKTIVELQAKIKDLSKKSSISEQETKKFQDAKSTLDAANRRLIVLGQDLRILEQIYEDDDLIQISDVNIFQLSEKLQNELSKELKSIGKDKLQEIIAQKITSIKADQTEARRQISENEKTITILKPKFEKQKELTGLADKQRELSKDVKRLAKSAEELARLDDERKDSFVKLKTAYFSFKEKQTNLFSTVNFEEFEFIEIKLDIKSNNKIRFNFLERNINTQRFANLSDKSKKFLQESELSEDNFDDILKDLFGEKFTLKISVTDKKQVIRDLLSNPYKIDFLDSIKVKDEKTAFRDMTGGQKAIAMLELIFKFDTNSYPILLDQPEDDLDTSGITTNVVDFIKKQKEKRQIFIVSHNAGLVVCSDSEEVIVADNSEGNFRYKSGAIEDDGIGAAIVDILEGGKEALRLRMNKLGVK